MTPVLNYARRYRCSECGAKSERRTLAGRMLATPHGWLCPPCWQRAEGGATQAQENEPAPRGEAIAPADAPLSLPPAAA